MRSGKIVVLVVFAALLIAGVAVAMQHEASVEMGKSLFSDPKLGTTGKSCNDCHKDGKGVEKAAAKKDLESTINACITKGIKGKALEANSVEMQSMVLYIKSLGGEQKPAAKKRKAPVGC